MQTASAFFSLPPDQVTARSEAHFFGALKTANDTFKRTGHGRLAAIDASLLAHLDRTGAHPDRVLDIGISSGTTTLELADALRKGGRQIRLTGTDRSFRAYLVDLPMGCRALIEPDGHILQYEVFGLPVRPWRRRLDYFTGRVLLGDLAHRLMRNRTRTALSRGEGRPLMLVSPRLAQSRAVSLTEDDITVRNSAFIGRFDLVRAANILNRHYFGDTALRQAVANVRSYLRGPGAWLLVVRTHGAADHRGTLFRLDDHSQLTIIDRYGPGSEVEALFTHSE